MSTQKAKLPDKIGTHKKCEKCGCVFPKELEECPFCRGEPKNPAYYLS